MSKIQRKLTQQIKIGDKFIGGDNNILIQSMTNTATSDVEATLEQIHTLENVGCDIVRVAVPDLESAKSISVLKSKSKLPIVADIHFNYKLALESIENGADKIRINPGNIGSEDRVCEILKKAKNYKIPIRIGLNSGSLPKSLLEMSVPESMCSAAMECINLFEQNDFTDIVISVKSSNVLDTIEAYKMISAKTNYPLHVGVTETGIPTDGIVKSAFGIGTLLYSGIGDTIRVSLTNDSTEEVRVGKFILRSLGYLKSQPEIISCPTCGRCKIDVIKIVNQLEPLISNINKNIKIAVMGCAVNGPGEAKEADVGIAGGDKFALLFKKGKIIRKISEESIINVLLTEIKDSP